LASFLEYVPGGTIGSCLLKHGRFDQEVTKWFAEQILAGLEYLHSTGILHRDLKGDNILVEPTGVCKISDFGISKKEDVQGQAFTQMKGTTFWMQVSALSSQSLTSHWLFTGLQRCSTLIIINGDMTRKLTSGPWGAWY
jgi:mitogen-activated protein kinase kinase kinase